MAEMRQVTPDEAWEIFTKQNALLSGHFVGAQGDVKGLGLHMPEYMNKRKLVTRPWIISRLGSGLAYLLFNYGVEAVVGMPLGAYTVAHEVAKFLGVEYAMAEKSPDGIVVAHSEFIEVVADRNVAVIEDTMTSSASAAGGMRAVEACGGHVTVVGALLDRGVNLRIGDADVCPLVRREMPTMTREECLDHGQCSRGEPINREPGHGRDLEQLIAEGRIPADPRYSFV